MAVVSLYHKGKFGDGSPFRHRTGDKLFYHAHWNWNIRESLFYPGADIVYLDAEDLSKEEMVLPRLEQVGQKLTYSIDLQVLFTIASRSQHGVSFDIPFPNTPDLPVYGVHWAVEVCGEKNYLGCFLRDIRTTS